MDGCCSSKQRSIDAQLDRTSMFTRFAMLGDLKNVKRMLAKEKMDPNAQDRFGMAAIHWGKLVCVQELLRAGASTEVVDCNGRNALHHAYRKDHKDVVQFLVESGKMNVNSVSESKKIPLHKAGE